MIYSLIKERIFCNDTKTEDVDPLGHDLVEDVAVAATCTTAGKEAGHHCSRCDYTDGGEAIAALGHDYKEQVSYDHASSDTTSWNTDLSKTLSTPYFFRTDSTCLSFQNLYLNCEYSLSPNIALNTLG